MARNTGWVRWVPDPKAEPEPKPIVGICDLCLTDNHERCVGVGCYGCTDPAHNRKHGSVSTLDDG